MTPDTAPTAQSADEQRVVTASRKVAASSEALFALLAGSAEQPPGHRGGWALDSLVGGRTRVTHSYDDTALPAEPAQRLATARAMTPEKLLASIGRLAPWAEPGAAGGAAGGQDR